MERLDLRRNLDVTLVPNDDLRNNSEGGEKGKRHEANFPLSMLQGNSS